MGSVLMYWVLPSDGVQDFLEKKLTQAIGLPVKLDAVSLRWTGVKIRDFTVSSDEHGGGRPIISAEELFLSSAPWELLYGEIDIHVIKLHEPFIYLKRDVNGKWNIDSLFGPKETSSEEDTAEEESGDPFFFQVQISDVQLSNGKIIIEDELTKRRLEISDFFVEGKELKSDGEFPFNLSAAVTYEQAGMPKQSIKLVLRSLLDLKEFNWEEASGKVKELIIRHEGGTFNLSGQVKKWGHPHAQLALSVRDLSDKIARFAASDMQPFGIDTLKIDLDAQADLQQNTLQVNSIKMKATNPTLYNADQSIYAQVPELNAYAKGSADWTHSKAKISSFTAQGLSTILSSTGTINWGGKNVAFSTHNFLEMDLAAWGQAFADWVSYQLKGTLEASADISSDQWSGTLQATQVGATLPGAGTLSDVSFTLDMPNKTQAKIPDLKGKINGGDFTGSLAATYTKTGITADLKARAARVALPPNVKSDAAEPEDSKQEKTTDEPSFMASLPPIALTAAVDIGSLDAPFIAAENLRFKADLKQMTAMLDKTHGTLSLSLGEGDIKDIDQLTHANILTRVLFGSLGAVSRVINSLNVLSVLNGIGSGLINTVTGGNKKEDQMVVQTIQDENGNDVHVLVPASSVSTSGRWAFEKFETALNFNNGVADISKGLFASDLMSFRLKGNMNFKTRGLDMKVQAAPGLHLEDGIMPLTIKIGGTLDDPSGSMSLSSTVTSMIGQTLTNNFAARTAKKGINSVVGLFKKKTPAEETDEQTDQAQSVEPSEISEENTAVSTSETQY